MGPTDGYLSETGSIVLAAYQPDPELFRRQLTSIREQSVTSFTCVITADGGRENVSSLVRDIVEDDPRFHVVGFDERVGFYRNFERGLRAVPSDAQWIALSDQDDNWYPEKLAVLLPHLSDAALVSGQARVVRHPSQEVVTPSTGRRNTGVRSYALDNQFTGGQMVFRREVLELALPFPGLATASEVHDHWLAVAAHFAGGALVVDRVVQDYVQHDANVIGERTAGFNPFHSVKTATTLSRKYEGGVSPAKLRNAVFKVGVGWRELMVETLARRVPANEDLEDLLRLYGSRRTTLLTLRDVASMVKQSSASMRSAAEYAAGCLAGLGPLRRRFSDTVASELDETPPPPPARS